MIGELEAALEGALGNAAVKILVFLSRFVLLLALDRQRMFARFDRQFTLIETGHRHGDAIGVFAGAFDVVGRIGLGLIGLAEAVEHGEEAIKADGGAIEGGEIDVTHGVLL